MMKYDEKYQIFIGLAIVLLMTEVLIGERKKSVKVEVGSSKSEASHIKRPSSNIKLQALSSVLLVLSVAASSPAAVRDILRQGNRLYADSQFADAVNKYNDVLVEQPQAVEPKFNKANSYYRLDDLGEAMNLYQDVAAASKDMALVAKAKYNLGNCYFQRGTKQRDSNLQKALEDMQASIAQWRQVLDLQPQNAKAARNIEVARLTIKDILDQMKQQQQQQGQQNQQGQKQQQQRQDQGQQQNQDQQKSPSDPNQPQDPNQAPKSEPQPDPNEARPQQKAAPEPQPPQEAQAAPDATAQEILDTEQRQKKEREEMLRQNARYRDVERDW